LGLKGMGKKNGEFKKKINGVKREPKNPKEVKNNGKPFFQNPKP